MSTDDMQRYREIRDNADPEDPTKAFLASLAVSYDQAIAEAIRLERGGKSGSLDRTLRRMGLTETADLLKEPITGNGRCGDIAPSLALIASRVRQVCCLTAGHAGWHRGDDGSEWSYGQPT
ncbi:hypothetical protein ACN27B_08610 [Micromonospora sp. WMMD754]|uniref:hypothetical protein n=1 Tax=Micromonospora sp. WMMD754 TaxID=3404114 RepID=UPI003BF52304